MNNELIFSFLTDLKNNNTKDWFEINKKRYEQMKESYHQLASLILESMKKHDETLAGLEVKNCVFRIHKDVRFSKDKTPYKTALGIILTPYGKKMSLAGYYVHLEPGGSFVGGGLYMPPNDMVKKVRQEIQNFPGQFLQIIQNKNFKTTYNDVEKNPDIMLQKVPKDVNPTDPIADYVRLKSFTTGKSYTNEMVFSDDFIDNCTKDFIAIKDFLQFINKGLMSDENGAVS